MAGAQSQVKGKITFDTTELQQGTQTTVEGLKQVAEQVTVTSDTMSTKSQAMAKAAEEAAARITAADLRASEAMKANAEARKALAAATRDVKAGAGADADAIILQADAMRTARLAAMQLAEANAALSVSQEHVAVSGQQAVSGLIRVSEGSGGLRAAENFIAKTLGLGGLAQVAFPVFGFAAVAEIVGKIGTGLYDAEQKAAHAGAAITEAFAEAHDKALVTNDDLRITSDRLQMEIDKLSGHPSDGLQLAIDEAIKRADQLLVSLRADSKEIQEIFKEHHIGFGASLLSGAQGTGTTEKEATAELAKLPNEVRKANADYLTALRQSKTPEAVEEAGRAHARAVRDAYATIAGEIRRGIEGLEEEEKKSRLPKRTVTRNRVIEEVHPIDNSAKRADLQGVLDKLQDRITQADIEETIASQQATANQLKGAKEAGEATKKSGEERFKAMEAYVAKWHTMAPVSAKALFEYWEEQKSAFAEGSQQYNSIQEKQAQIATTGADKFAAGIAKIKADEKRIANEGADLNVKLNGPFLSMTAVDPEKWDGYRRELARADEAQAAMNARMQEADVQSRVALGALSPLAAAQELAAIHARQHAEALKALERELEQLEARAKKDPVSGNFTDPKEAERIQRVRNQISAERGNAALAGRGDTEKIALAMARPYLNAVNEVESGWARAQRQILAGQKSFAAAMKAMWGDIAINAIQNIEHIGFEFVRHEIMMVARKAAAKQAQTTIEAAGSAAATNIAKKEDAEVGLGAAKKAFKNTYAVVSGWPVVGPILAPILAPAAFAAVAAFEQGTPYIPRAGVAMLHPGEAVLGSPSAQVMRDAFAGKLAGGNREANIYLGGNNFSQAGGDFRSQWAANERHIVRRLKTLRREGHI